MTTLPPFFFQRRQGKLNWRRIGDVDLKQLINETNVDLLQEHVENITFADITEEDLAYFTDVHFLKLFRLSQLTIEYLLHIQNYLATSAKDVETRLSQAESLHAEAQAANEANNEKIANLKRDVKYYRKLAHAYEQLHGPLASHHLQNAMSNATPGNMAIDIPTSTPGPATESLPNNMFNAVTDREGRTVFKCALCRSAYSTSDFLLSHVNRRHPEHTAQAALLHRGIRPAQTTVTAPLATPVAATTTFVPAAASLIASRQIEHVPSEADIEARINQRVNAAVTEVMAKLQAPSSSQNSQTNQSSADLMDRFRNLMQVELGYFSQLQASKLSTLEAKLETVNLRLKTQPSNLQLVANSASDMRASIDAPLRQSAVSLMHDSSTQQSQIVATSNSTGTVRSGISSALLDDVPAASRIELPKIVAVDNKDAVRASVSLLDAPKIVPVQPSAPSAPTVSAVQPVVSVAPIVAPSQTTAINAVQSADSAPPVTVQVSGQPVPITSPVEAPVAVVAPTAQATVLPSVAAVQPASSVSAQSLSEDARLRQEVAELRAKLIEQAQKDVRANAPVPTPTIADPIAGPVSSVAATQITESSDAAAKAESERVLKEMERLAHERLAERKRQLEAVKAEESKVQSQDSEWERFKQQQDAKVQAVAVAVDPTTTEKPVEVKPVDVVAASSTNQQTSSNATSLNASTQVALPSSTSAASTVAAVVPPQPAESANSIVSASPSVTVAPAASVSTVPQPIPSSTPKHHEPVAPVQTVPAVSSEFMIDSTMPFLPPAAVPLQRDWIVAIMGNIQDTVSKCTKEMLIEQEDLLRNNAAGTQVMNTVSAWIDDIVSKHFQPSIQIPPALRVSVSQPRLASQVTALPTAAGNPVPAAAIRDSLDILAESDESFVASLQQALREADAQLQQHRPLSGAAPRPRSVHQTSLSASLNRSGLGLALQAPSSGFSQPDQIQGIQKLRHSRTSMEGLRASFQRFPPTTAH